MLFSLVAAGENINVNIASSEKKKTKTKTNKQKKKKKNQPRVQKCCESVFSFPDILLNN